MGQLMEKKPLTTLPVPSTSFVSDPTFTNPGGVAELSYEFQREGVLVRSGLRFERVRAFRFRAEGHATIWHLQGAYDTLVEVVSSDWAKELLDAEPRETSGRWTIRHFLIYVDSAGAYEVAAESWSMLPEVLGD
jgi:hypothetical protein